MKMPGESRAVLETVSVSPVTAMRWAPDGARLAYGTRDGKIVIITVADGSEIILGAHANTVQDVAFSPDGKLLLTASDDTTILLWDVDDQRLKGTFTGPAGVMAVVWSPDGLRAASADTKYVRLWNIREQKLEFILVGHAKWVRSLIWIEPNLLVSGGNGGDLFFWPTDGSTGRKVPAHNGPIFDMAYSSAVSLLATASGDNTIGLWDYGTATKKHQLEGHTSRVESVSLSVDATLLASADIEGKVRIGTSQGREFWEAVASFESAPGHPLVRFHPSQPRLATVTGGGLTLTVRDVELSALTTAPATTSAAHYASAKIVLVGETGAGKTCLARALLSQAFIGQPSTHGMGIWNFRTEDCGCPDEQRVVRDTILWDLAGQSDYQIVHQLFLDKTDLGVVVFDGSHSDDPFRDVPYWTKALRRIAGPNCPLLLVAAKTDVATPVVSAQEIERFRVEYGFQAYIRTSAATNEGVDELRDAILCNVPWSTVPVTTSPQVWRDVRTYLLQLRDLDRVLITSWDLREAIRHATSHQLSDADFETVVRHAQAQGLLWQLARGALILLRPELLNSYGGAVVQFARRDPNGLGSVDERSILEARIDLTAVQRIADAAAERSLLLAVVEMFLTHQIALRERDQLVFPSKLTRNPPQPRPENPQMVFHFSGPTEQIYATLIVRLYYSGAFEWRARWTNAAEFSDTRGKICGIAVNTLDGGSASLELYFGNDSSIDSKILFTHFVQQHLVERAISGAVTRHRIYYCAECGHRVMDQHAVDDKLRAGKSWIWCTHCDEVRVNLVDDIELRFNDALLREQMRKIEEVVDHNAAHAIACDVFLAYNHHDEAMVTRIAEALKSNGVRLWFAPWSLYPGDRWKREIDRALQSSAAIAVFVGKQGLGNTHEVEIEIAVDQATKRNAPVIPVLLPDFGAGRDGLPTFLSPFTEVGFHAVEDEHALRKLISGIRKTRLVSETAAK